jgi:hypothetical protein
VRRPASVCNCKPVDPRVAKSPVSVHASLIAMGVMADHQPRRTKLMGQRRLATDSKNLMKVPTAIAREAGIVTG